MSHKKALVVTHLIVAMVLITLHLFTQVIVPPQGRLTKVASKFPLKANGWMQEGAYQVVVRFYKGSEIITVIYVEVTEGENYWVKNQTISIDPDTILSMNFVFPEVTQYPSTAQVRVYFGHPYVIIPVQRAHKNGVIVAI